MKRPLLFVLLLIVSSPSFAESLTEQAALERVLQSESDLHWIDQFSWVRLETDGAYHFHCINHVICDWPDSMCEEWNSYEVTAATGEVQKIYDPKIKCEYRP